MVRSGESSYKPGSAAIKFSVAFRSGFGTRIAFSASDGVCPGDARPPDAAGRYADWTLDAAGRLIAVDETGHRIAVQQADQTFRFVGGPGGEPGRFRYPRSIALAGETAYVVDSWNHRVQMFRLPDWTLLGAFGGLGEGPGRFFCPGSLAVLARPGQPPWLVVADTNNRRLVFHDARGQYLFDYGLSGSRFPVKVRSAGLAIEVRYEDGGWERLEG